MSTSALHDLEASIRLGSDARTRLCFLSATPRRGADSVPASALGTRDRIGQTVPQQVNEPLLGVTLLGSVRAGRGSNVRSLGCNKLEARVRGASRVRQLRIGNRSVKS